MNEFQFFFSQVCACAVTTLCKVQMQPLERSTDVQQILKVFGIDLSAFGYSEKGAVFKKVVIIAFTMFS